MAKSYWNSKEEVEVNLLKYGFSWSEDYGRYQRDSWYAVIEMGKGRFKNKWTYTVY